MGPKPVPPPPPQPPPPPPPPRLPQVTLSSDCISGNYGENLVGQTETKEITENEFIAQVCDLVESRLPTTDTFREDEGQTQDSQGLNSTILVVATPMKKAILQNGPMCGIVALAEALHLLSSENDNDQHVDPCEILKDAVRRGFTKQGEMFSVKAMQCLAEIHGKCDKSRIVGNETGSQERFEQFLGHTLEGYPSLFPYDADFNHTPSLRKGHAAHWAVVYGLVTRISPKRRKLVEENSSFLVLKSSPEMIFVKPIHATGPVINSSLLFNLFNCESVHVLAHQGKSFRVALWKYADLIESNSNLKEVAPKILANQSDYKLFESIDVGLCSQILLLKK